MYPEMLIRIYMEVHNCSMEQAVVDLEDVQVDDMVWDTSIRIYWNYMYLCKILCPSSTVQ
jgi:hypothetical protein